jgi:hypothetical protein
MRDADEMVDILVAATFSALHDKYSIEGQEEWIIELDSSTEVLTPFDHPHTEDCIQGQLPCWCIYL